MQAAITAGDIALDFRAMLHTEQRYPLGAAGNGAIWRDRRIDEGVGVPPELEGVGDHIEAYQAGMWASAGTGLKPRARAAILAIGGVRRLGWCYVGRWFRCGAGSCSRAKSRAQNPTNAVHDGSFK